MKEKTHLTRSEEVALLASSLIEDLIDAGIDEGAHFTSIYPDDCFGGEFFGLNENLLLKAPSAEELAAVDLDLVMDSLRDIIGKKIKEIAQQWKEESR